MDGSAGGDSVGGDRAGSVGGNGDIAWARGGCRLGAPFAPLGVVSKIHGTGYADGDDMFRGFASGTNGAIAGGITGRNGTVGGGGDLSSLGAHMFAVHSGRRLLFSCGFWDFSVKVTALDSDELVQSIARHLDVVTSLALSEAPGCERLVTASRDCTLMVWALADGCAGGGWEPPVLPTPLRVLYGHDDALACVAVSAGLDTVASAADDGTVMLHSLWDGMYVRTLVCSSAADGSSGGGGGDNGGRDDGVGCGGGGGGDGSSNGEEDTSGSGGGGGGGRSSNATKAPPVRVDWVGLSPAGYVLSYSSGGGGGTGGTLCSHTLNGRLLAVVTVPSGERLHAFCLSHDGEVLVAGGAARVVRFLWAHSLAPADDGPRAGFPAAATGACAKLGTPSFSAAVRALTLTAGERHLLVGLADGALRVLAFDPSYLRKRLKRKLEMLGF
ncbi:unnamed protein product [Phaeothamnion confervicola]